MTIVDDLTPVHYRHDKIFIYEREGVMVAMAGLTLLNAEGGRIGEDTPIAALTPGEIAMLESFVARELAVYEMATGLTEWTE